MIYDTEAIVSLWASGKTADEIADVLLCERRTVFWHLNRARKAGDTRAKRVARPQALRRRYKIEMLAQIGWPTVEIAALVECTPRFVQMRTREMRDG